MLCLQEEPAEALARRFWEAGRVVIAFPAYLCAPPAGLWAFLAVVRQQAVPGAPGPAVYLIIQGNGLEAQELRPAAELCRGFCRQAGLACRVALLVGSGDLILNTPFRGLVNKELKLLARELCGGLALREEILVQMPLTPKAFAGAMQRHWKKLRQPAQEEQPAKPQDGAARHRGKGAGKRLFTGRKPQDTGGAEDVAESHAGKEETGQ